VYQIFPKDHQTLVRVAYHIFCWSIGLGFTIAGIVQEAYATTYTLCFVLDPEDQSVEDDLQYIPYAVFWGLGFLVSLPTIYQIIMVIGFSGVIANARLIGLVIWYFIVALNVLVYHWVADDRDDIIDGLLKWFTCYIFINDEDVCGESTDPSFNFGFTVWVELVVSISAGVIAIIVGYSDPLVRSWLKHVITGDFANLPHRTSDITQALTHDSMKVGDVSGTSPSSHERSSPSSHER